MRPGVTIDRNGTIGFRRSRDGGGGDIGYIVSTIDTGIIVGSQIGYARLENGGVQGQDQVEAPGAGDVSGIDG